MHRNVFENCRDRQFVLVRFPNMIVEIVSQAIT